MKYYIATGLHNTEQYRYVHERVGGILTYDWAIHGPAWDQGADRLRQVADAELEGVEAADFLIVLLTGGRDTHVELGYGLALKKKILLYSENRELFQLQPETCAFYHSDRIFLRTTQLGVLIETAKLLLEGL